MGTFKRKTILNDFKAEEQEDDLTQMVEYSTQEAQSLVADDLEGDLDSKEEMEDTKFMMKRVAPGFVFSIRHLALITLGFGLIAHLFLIGQCHHARNIRKSTSEPLLSEWKVLTNYTSHRLYIVKSAGSDHREDEVDPGQLVKFIGKQRKGFDHVISPSLGWTRHINLKTNQPYFEKLRDDPDVSEFCPIIYTSIASEEKSSRYMRAPQGLNLGQSFWNAAQIFHLLLLVALIYDTATPAEGATITNNLSPVTKLLVRSIAIGTIILLPFSGYLISPGAHVWAALSLVACCIAFSRPIQNLHISVVQNTSDAPGIPSSIPWMIIREETLCMLCYLGSSLYNSAAAASYRSFPWFYYWWKWIDENVLDDPGVSLNHLYNMGDDSVNIPPFVPTAKERSETKTYVFTGVWSLLPALYAFNFMVMIMMSSRSPGKWIQRTLATFGLIHFLFWTDFVDYKYGRGYKNLSSEGFHWTEKWSWRLGILIPVYQNCTNGHWGKSYHVYSFLGRFVRWFGIVGGILFFLFQTIQADIPRTYGFLTGAPEKSLVTRWGLDKKSNFFKRIRYPYFEALVWGWGMYGLLHLLCFRLYRIVLRRASTRNASQST